MSAGRVSAEEEAEEAEAEEAGAEEAEAQVGRAGAECSRSSDGGTRALLALCTVTRSSYAPHGS